VTTKNKSFLEILLETYPGNKSRWPKTSLLTPLQILLLSYGVEPEPNDLPKDSSPVQLDKFLKEVDQYCIFDLVQDAIRAKSLTVYEEAYVKAEDFVKWTDMHQIPIRREFFYVNRVQDDGQCINDATQHRSSTSETLRKDIARSLASLYIKSQKRSGAKSMGPTDFARHKDVIDIIKKINALAGIDPIKGKCRETGVDPEWFSDLFPDETKPGPHRK